MSVAVDTQRASERKQRSSGARLSGAPAPTPRDLPAFLPHALAQLQADFSVHVTVHTQDEYVSPVEKKKTVRSRTTVAAVPSMTLRESRQNMSASATALPAVFGDGRDEELHVDAVQDAQARLVALALRRARVPCLLLKLLALCAPHQALLTRLTLQACALDALALHQLAQLLPRSGLTELVLDDSPVHAGGYHLLLEAESRLCVLSLDRCALGDAGAVALADALRHPRPASRMLRSLSLATDGIGDAGAVALGDALRSNRHLQHLNLADNRLTDAGATAIVRPLSEFALSAAELLDSRRRRVERLRRRLAVFQRIYGQLLEAGVRTRDASGGRKTRRPLGAGGSAVTLGGVGAQYDALRARADLLTTAEMGPFFEPFAPEETSARGGHVYSPGNGALRWLNLAYNSLGHRALVELLRVLRAPAGAGLLRVVLEGNALPAASAELGAVAQQLDHALDRAIRPAHRKTERITRINKK